MGGYLDLINDWEVKNPLPPPLTIIYSNVTKSVKPIEQLVTRHLGSLKVQSKKLDVALMAKNIVSEIEGKVLAIGWTVEQLKYFNKTLSAFIPAKIGAITLQAIEIIILHSDGSPRGAVKFYNHEVDQPWLIHSKKGDFQ